MFNNLIESTSHAKEFKRRGSFLLFTTATYVVLFAVTGVISIYAYDAHLESQRTELEITFVPLPPEEVAPRDIPNTIRPASNSDNQPTRSMRTELIDSPSNPNNPPPTVGTVAHPVPPARWDSERGPVNADPPGPPAGSRDVGGGTGNIQVDMTDPPPPPPAPNPTPVVPRVLKISTVLNSRAVSLPRPIYPKLAQQIRLQGTVTVQVLIDETGRVVSAKGTGHPLLVPEAQKAAMQARFSPTVITETPVKVSGVITYNFVIQ
jgi:protein TonB